MSLRKLTCSLAVSCLSFLAATLLAQEPVNLVRNPGFEEIDPDGRAVGWDGSAPYYTVSTETARTGKASLHFSHQEPKPYVLCGQNIELDKKKFHRFGAWVKSSGMKGGGPTVCVEWWDKDGKYLGGSYPSGAKDTNGKWVLVEDDMPHYIPAEATRFNITCYCRQGSTGEAWFDDVFLYEYIPPFLGVLTTDCYRHYTTGEPMTVFASIITPQGDVRPEELPGILLKLLTTDGKELQSFRPMGGPDEKSIRFVVPTADLAPGDYVIRLDAVNPNSGQTDSKQLTIHRVATLPAWKSYIDSHRRLIVDGKPFFPLGMYFGGISDSDLEIYRDSPFNCLMPYNYPKREALDIAEAAGIKVIYSVKDFYSGRGDLKTPQEASDKTASVVESLKDHPAIIAWYINDERPLKMIDELSARRDQMERLDPGRPTWTVLYQVSEVRDYIPSFDVIGTDPYPIPNLPPSQALDWARWTTMGAFGSFPNWMVPQAFNWAAYYWKGHGKTDEEILAYRAPTAAELKAMTWMCIAGGATGLVYYSWFDLHHMDKLIADGGRALRRDPFKERWAEIKAVAADVKRLDQVLLGIETPLAITPAPETPAKIGVRLFGKDGETWLLAVNADHEKNAVVTFTAPQAITCLGQELGGKPPQITGTTITLELDPLEVTMLRLK
ncbi:MAG: hypothetical protein GX937_10765 [Lentisphaerae bacterium]|jgi:hypothetical protein|nr:hypothetical protein [Lentisphaerota bacterium]